MKHQYLGDTRDLFKYDLIELLLSRHPSLDQAFFITMLTPDDGSGHGERADYSRAKAGYLNSALSGFLSRLRDARTRNCFLIRDYFSERSLQVNIERSHFTHHGREEYFSRIARKVRMLSHFLIFLDPDTGLEVAVPTSAHLLYAEVSLVTRAAGRGSIVMIYQHIPRTPRIPYIEARCASLSQHTGFSTSWISDGQVVFFFLCGEYGVRKDLEACLVEYWRRYPLLLS